MVWAVILSLIVGAVCAVWLPILIYTIAAAVLVIGCTVAGFIAGLGAMEIAGRAFFLTLALASGCIAAHVGLYLVYVRRKATSEKRNEVEIGSKYLSD
jgi:uncharacterized membrane protein